MSEPNTAKTTTVEKTHEWSADEGNVKRCVLVFAETLDPGKLRKRGDSGKDRIRRHCNVVISGLPSYLIQSQTFVIARVNSLVWEPHVTYGHL